MINGVDKFQRGLGVLIALAVYGCSPSSDTSTDDPSDAAPMDAASVQDGSLLDMSTIPDAAPDMSGPLDSSVDVVVSGGDTEGPDAISDAGGDAGDMRAPAPRPVPQRVLFIGNSFTFWHDGLASHMEAMRASADNAGPFEAEQVVRGGASLEVMWNQTNARNRIARGNYDVVVLQEDIPETNIESFHTHARLFDQAIRDSGATPVLFMAWDYRRLNWITMDEIAEAHWTIADELGIAVAPAGLAWKRASRERPGLDMYDDDDEHPSIHGVYLTTSTIYAVLFGESPEGLGYRPRQAGGVSDAEAAFLQRIAWAEVSAR